MAVREGFEPSIGYNAYTPLAGERLQPLGHLTFCIIVFISWIKVADSILIGIV